MVVVVVVLAGAARGIWFEYFRLQQQSAPALVSIYEQPDVKSTVIGKLSEEPTDLTGNYTEDYLWGEVYIDSEKTETGWIQLSAIMTAALTMIATENLADEEIEMPETQEDTEIPETDRAELSNTSDESIMSQAVDDFVESLLNTFNLSVGEEDKPSAAIWMSGSNAKCYSSDTAVVTVSSQGKVTAVGTGTAYVVFMVVNGPYSLTQAYKYVVT
ncbi:MAG: hypothetical protein LUG93_18280 [Lachnospiraceae bacterium]|nr:hypothetical protein [Lachnospiraceae bacterium]